MNCKDINKKLSSISHVLDYIVLDAGQCIYLIISTGGYSTYMPTQGITVVTKEGAMRIADSYWHKGTFLQKLNKLGRD